MPMSFGRISDMTSYFQGGSHDVISQKTPLFYISLVFLNLGLIVLQANTQRLTESDFTLSSCRPWHYFCRNMLPPGKCTCGIHSTHMKQHLPAAN